MNILKIVLKSYWNFLLHANFSQPKAWEIIADRTIKCNFLSKELETQIKNWNNQQFILRGNLFYYTSILIQFLKWLQLRKKCKIEFYIVFFMLKIRILIIAISL